VKAKEKIFGSEVADGRKLCGVKLQEFALMESWRMPDAGRTDGQTDGF
jgi:hypothetical protein